LKKQWEANITKNIDEESNSNSPSSPASLSSITNNLEGETNNFMNGLGKGIAGVIGGIQKVKESELYVLIFVIIIIVVEIRYGIK
jgi:hypothetical protein